MADERKKVLIVEDDRTFLNLYELYLSESGFDVTGVFYEGLGIDLPKEKYYAVISDGLLGHFRRVGLEIEAERKILVTADRRIEEMVSGDDWEIIGKSGNCFKKVAEALK
jgi:DNA-binding response OmpR family regulator